MADLLDRNRWSRRMPSGAPGFTLIELMIVIAIVGVLMGIAVARYEFAVVKSRRSAAQGCLTEAAQYMERYHTKELSYEDAVMPGCSADVADHYAVDFSVVPNSTAYTIRATPQGRQGEAETRCRTMTMDQAGRRTGATSDCWSTGETAEVVAGRRFRPK